MIPLHGLAPNAGLQFIEVLFGELLYHPTLGNSIGHCRAAHHSHSNQALAVSPGENNLDLNISHFVVPRAIAFALRAA